MAQTAVLLPAGNATDRIGRRPVMIASGIVCGLAAIAMPYSTSIWVLVIVLWIAAAQGAIGSQLWLGVLKLGPWQLHPLVLMFAVSGVLMVSKTVRIPKP